MKNIIFLTLLLVLITPFVYANEVGVGIYALNFGKLDISTGSYTADFYLSLKCLTNCTVDNFEFMNGRMASIDRIIDSPEEKFYRISANLNTEMDFQNFPFDSQNIKIIIEDKKHPISEVRYVPLVDETGFDDSVIFPGWKINSYNVTSTAHEYDIYNETYSQYVFTLNIGKYYWNSFFKTFLPVLITMLIVLLTFILDPDKIVTRLTINSSSLIAVVMFHISIANQLPPLGYLTFADKFMLLTYLILLLCVIINITILEFVEQKKTELVEKIHRRTEFGMFIIVPLLYILFFLFI